MTGRFFLRSVKALVRVTLSDSFRIRPPSIYRAPGIARPCHQMGHLVASEIQSFYTQYGARVVCLHGAVDWGLEIRRRGSGKKISFSKKTPQPSEPNAQTRSEGFGRRPPDLLGPRLRIRLRKLRSQMANNKWSYCCTLLLQRAIPGGCVAYGKTLLEFSTGLPCAT